MAEALRVCIIHRYSFFQGTVRLLLTRIPMFHDVIIMSFQCPHCHTSNNEIQPGTPIQEKGDRYTLSVNNTEVSWSESQVFRTVSNY